MELAEMTCRKRGALSGTIQRPFERQEPERPFKWKEAGNASLAALLEVQHAFQGAAEEMGLRDEEDVVRMVKAIRAGRDGGYRCE